MSDVPVQVVVAAFQDEASANKALDQLKEAKSQGLIEIRDAAVLKKDMDGKLHIQDTKDWGFGKGALAGGVVGIVIGLLAGPVGWGLLAGALIGGTAAKLSDGGFDNKRLEQIGASLKPGSSAIIAVLDLIWVAQMEQMMAEAGADATTQAISADIAKQLDEGRDVIYTAIAADGAVVMNKTAVGKDSAEIGNVVATKDGVYAEGATINKDGGKAAAMLATSEGVKMVSADLKPVTDSAADAPKAVTAGAADAAAGAADAANTAAAGATNAAAGAGEAAKPAAAGAADAAADAAKPASS